MRHLLLAITILAACKGNGNAPKPHDPVKGPAMWKTDLVALSMQELGDDDKPKGESETLSARQDGVMRCRLEKDPGNDAVTTWITSSVIDGHMRMTHDRDKVAADDVNGCAHQAAANVKLPSTLNGEYKFTMKVVFSEPQP